LSATGLLSIGVAGPYALVWLLAFLGFSLQLIVALACENEDKSVMNLLLVFAMYFTYCQFWIPVVAWAFCDDFVFHRPVKWAKTRRFQGPVPPLGDGVEVRPNLRSSELTIVSRNIGEG
jgi:hypothetical protein